MDIKVRLADEKDINELGQLYDEVCDDLAAHVNYPGWKKGVYPTREDAEAGIKEKALFVATIGDRIAGTVILRHKPEDGYRTAVWQKELDDEQVYVIYTFAVHPAFAKQGVGKALMDFAEEYARKSGMKAIRLDVVDQNLPAINLYKKCGFQYIQTVDLGYSDYGLDWFELYEKLL